MSIVFLFVRKESSTFFVEKGVVYLRRRSRLPLIRGRRRCSCQETNIKYLYQEIGINPRCSCQETNTGCSCQEMNIKYLYQEIGINSRCSCQETNTGCSCQGTDITHLSSRDRCQVKYCLLCESKP